ncbi:hypothetical protein BDV59DRAFT_200985 [Aspergillus ambiguus]|uniref:uncharacterized protein n=1 Tax=Aspergillus ambiguus TaxID=176160 RepID=UPI003CCCB6C6
MSTDESDQELHDAEKMMVVDYHSTLDNDTISTHTTSQVKSSVKMKPTVASDSMDTDLDKIISSVTSIEMFTEGLLSTPQTFGKKRIVFKNLKVSRSKYQDVLNWLTEAYYERNNTTMEYNEKTGTVIGSKDTPEGRNCELLDPSAHQGGGLARPRHQWPSRLTGSL